MLPVVSETGAGMLPGLPEFGNLVKGGAEMLVKVGARLPAMLSGTDAPQATSVANALPETGARVPPTLWECSSGVGSCTGVAPALSETGAAQARVVANALSETGARVPPTLWETSAGVGSGTGIEPALSETGAGLPRPAVTPGFGAAPRPSAGASQALSETGALACRCHQLSTSSECGKSTMSQMPTQARSVPG